MVGEGAIQSEAEQAMGEPVVAKGCRQGAQEKPGQAMARHVGMQDCIQKVAEVGW